MTLGDVIALTIGVGLNAFNVYLAGLVKIVMNVQLAGQVKIVISVTQVCHVEMHYMTRLLSMMMIWSQTIMVTRWRSTSCHVTPHYKKSLHNAYGDEVGLGMGVLPNFG